MKKVYQERTQLVTKSNALIQKGRYNLTITQQRIILYLISKIKPDDTEFQTSYQIDIGTFCEVCGLHQKDYDRIKHEAKALMQAVVEIDIPKIEYRVLHWVREVKVLWGFGTILIQLEEKMKPYLLQLHERFTSYELQWVLTFRRKYTIRLYEYICSRHFHNLDEYSFTIKPDELQAIMGADEYRFADFRKFVLDKAQEEINEKTDKNIDYTMQQGKNRKVEAIQITVRAQDAVTRAKHERDNNIALGIDPDQLTLWDYLGDPKTENL